MVLHRLTLPLALALLVPACGPKPAPPTTTPEPAPEPEPVDPIPEGFFTLTPQLVVADVDTAVEFYGKAFGATKVYSMPGPDGTTMHAEIKIGDSIMMLDKENVDQGMKSPATLGGTPGTLMMYVDDADATYQAAMDAGARAWTPVEEMFWGDRYGELEDPFGHRWALATHVEDLTPEQMQQRAELAMPPADPKKAKKAKKAKKGPPAWKEVAGTPATDPTPDAYHTVTLALTTSDANAAIEFYKAAFGAQDKELMPGPDGKVMHAELTIGDSVLMLSDERPDMGYKSATTLGGSPITVHMYTTDVEATFTQATGAGGTEAMALTNMFWGDRYGMVVDPAGISWGVAMRVEIVAPEQMEERMKAQMAAEGGGEAPADAVEADAAADPAS
ncbi:VOC family protein [Paraliomyxa miuraensis]|uniref:VOC family protein n=1 Tax=Paraliomyxa miuraensis TaxID=376150 RepID=UPI00225234AC|nr:VOC family protein [Paraliomyxa miuraensis]MCX4246238.1 VOC family protein [Paraliomyxa miuraensis]